MKYLGLNYRMSEAQAAIGIAQMKKLNNILKIREKNFNLLKEKLYLLKDLEILKTGSVAKFKSAYYALNIILKKNLKKKRRHFIEKLKSFGIGTSIYYPKIISDLSYYKKKYKINNSRFPKAKMISYESITLPVGPHISKSNIIYITSKIKNILRELNR